MHTKKFVKEKSTKYNLISNINSLNIFDYA